MLFKSFEFAVFLPIVVGIYWFLPRVPQNRMFLAASYVFYGAWDWRFLGLILLSTVVDYTVGLRIGPKTIPTTIAIERRRRAWVALSVSVNLTILGFFKYFNFFADSIVDLLQTVGFTSVDPMLVQVVLPVGISFYTFQTISYSIDIYRGELEPTKSFFDFALFVAFFPQLVAGPIERAKVLMPQILTRRSFSSDQFIDGLALIFWWGAYQGALLCAHRLYQDAFPSRSSSRGDRALSFGRVVQIVAMFHLICGGWLIFRGRSVAQILDMSAAIFTMRGTADWLLLFSVAGFVAPLAFVEAAQLRYGREEVHRVKGHSVGDENCHRSDTRLPLRVSRGFRAEFYLLPVLGGVAHA